MTTELTCDKCTHSQCKPMAEELKKKLKKAGQDKFPDQWACLLNPPVVVSTTWLIIPALVVDSSGPSPLQASLQNVDWVYPRVAPGLEACSHFSAKEKH